jgi:hypothetical protein
MMSGFPGRLRCAALSFVAAALCACQQRQDGYYDIPPATAFARLQQADLTGFRDARQCGMLIYFSEKDDGSQLVTWTATSSDIRVVMFRFRVAPSQQGSIISIEVPRGPNGAEIYDGHQKYTHPALMQPLRPALRELVDAATEQRPYDWHRIPDPLNTDGLCGSLRQNFEASGQPYRIDDPLGMTHAQAEDARNSDRAPPVQRDDVFGDNPWGE